MSVEELVSHPYSVWLIGEMGTGKSTFLKLILAYQDWLQANFGLEQCIFHSFPENVPEKALWDQYLYHKDNEIPHASIYLTQTHFAREKFKVVNIASGYEDGLKQDLDPRTPGFYFVDRSLQEDYYVFASGLKHLFPGKTPFLRKGTFSDYEKEIKGYLARTPEPDLILRFRVASPSVSQERVRKRGWGEQLELSRYYIMAEAYEKYIDTWISQAGIPALCIHTDRPHLDFSDLAGQKFYLTTFFSELMHLKDKGGSPYWNLPYILLPGEMLNINNSV